MLWGLTVVGLCLRALRQSTLAGTYNARLDELIYAGQRLWDGQLLYVGLVNGTLPLVQWLYAPSAWFGTIHAHRVLILLVNACAAGLFAGAIRQLAQADLMALSRGSVLPLAGATLLITASQMLPGGPSGLPEHFANAFLALALFVLSRVGADQGARRRWGVVAAGAALALAQQTAPRLTTPLLMVILLAIVLLRLSRPFAVGLTLVVGGLLAALLPFAPYVWLPQGGSLLWAGAVRLPVEQAARFPAGGDRLFPLLGEFLQTGVAGLPVWVLAVIPSAALLEYLARQAWLPFGPGDRLVLIPALSLVFLLETLLAFLSGGFEADEMLLLVLPLVMIIVCGFAVLERSPWRRRVGGGALLVLSLILFNNVFLASLFHAPRPPNDIVRDVESDRSATRRYFQTLPESQRTFTAPQDGALQRQLRQPATTTGIGPEWSLNHQNLATSWATRRLQLPTEVGAVCRQLTDPANRHLVWMRTDPEGPNTEAFFRACLDRQPGQWQEISEELHLTSGQYRVFRRRSSPVPAAPEF